MYDVIIAGAGFAGSVIARECAEQGKKVLILEKRSHTGGNMFECDYSNGVRIHKYGPHIFHTSDKQVFDYLSRFTDWFPYEHKVVGLIDGQLVPIPFNFKSIDMLFDTDKAEKIKNKLIEEKGLNNKISVFELINSDDKLVRELGEFVYEKVFVHYTAKQWGTTIDKIDKSTINRVPVVIGYDDRYFNDTIQYMPQNGFTELFNNLLDNENITIKLNINANEKIKLEDGKTYFDGEEFSGKIVYTGAVDELMDYKFGKLPYRSLKLVFEALDQDCYQKNSVVNYPNSEDFTRITEFKYLTGQRLDGKTVILKEYPVQYNSQQELEPYYPIINENNIEIYNKYENELKAYSNVILCGRLAEYKYYNMDAIVKRALEIAEKMN